MLYTYIICIPKITQNIKTYPSYETVSDVVLPCHPLPPPNHMMYYLSFRENGFLNVQSFS